jgi:FkbM family methyltransferase
MSRFKTIAYKIIDAMTLGRGIKRNIGGADIRLPSSVSRFYKSDYEPETVKYLRENLKPGETFIDIGAHIGLFTVLAARLVGKTGKVITFEPTPVTLQALKSVVKMNGCSSVVTVRGEAMSEEKGTAVFYDTGDTMSVTNSLIKNETSCGEIEVPTISLDEFVMENDIAPDIIKIDVEGAELKVLRGSRRTLEIEQPKVRLSLHPPFHDNDPNILDETWSFLRELDYNVDFGGQEIDKTWFCSQTGFFDVNLVPQQ